jgi:hypothetical protein
MRQINKAGFVKLVARRQKPEIAQWATAAVLLVRKGKDSPTTLDVLLQHRSKHIWQGSQHRGAGELGVPGGTRSRGDRTSDAQQTHPVRLDSEAKPSEESRDSATTRRSKAVRVAIKFMHAANTTQESKSGGSS